MTSPAQALVDDIRAAFNSPETAALIIESKLAPVVGTHVSPPTYAGESAGSPRYAETDSSPVPAPDEDGFFTKRVTDADGLTLRRPAVILDSVGSQATRAERLLWENRERLGGLPGFVVKGVKPSAGDFGSGSIPDHIKEETGRLIEGTTTSSWEVAHRHVDAWVKNASPDGGKTSVWAGGSEVRDLLTGINTTVDATTAYQHAVNAILFGFWLSSGVPVRHRHARIYSSEIVGYDAAKAPQLATKGTPLDILAEVKAIVNARGELELSKKGKKPAELGYGSVPTKGVRYTYEPSLILRQASVSVAGLRNVSFGGSEEKTAASAVVVILLGLIGHHLSAADLDLRAGCALVAESTSAGWRRAGGGTAALAGEPFSLEYEECLDLLVEAFQIAVADAEGAGLEFAAPLELTLHSGQVKLLAQSIATSAMKSEAEASA